MWQVELKTQNYVYWSYVDKDGKKVYDVTKDAKTPPACEGGYYNLDSLRRLKDDWRVGRTIRLPVEDITITINEGGGAVTSSLNNTEADEDEIGFYDGQIDALYSILLAHALGGVNVEDPAYVAGIQAVVDSMFNNL